MKKIILILPVLLAACGQVPAPATSPIPIPPQSQTCFSALVSSPTHDLKTLLSIAEHNADCATLAQEALQLAVRAALLAVQ
jgi:hypothetical protein